VYPFQSQKIFRVFSNFSFSNGKDSIELYCGDILQDALEWQEKIEEGYILFSDGTPPAKAEYNISRGDFTSLEEYREFIAKTWKANIRKLKS